MNRTHLRRGGLLLLLPPAAFLLLSLPFLSALAALLLFLFFLHGRFGVLRAPHTLLLRSPQLRRRRAPDSEVGKVT